jgi:hypothetical protein
VPPAPSGFLQRPGAIAVAPDGSLVIADGDRIVRRAVDGAFSVVAQLGATSLAVGPDRTVFFGGPDGVGAIAPDGAVSTVAALPNIASIALSTEAGTLYAVDDDGVVAVAADGSTRDVVVGHRFVDVHGTPMAFFPSAVAVGADGNLFVADGGVKLLAKFAPDGTLLDAWGPQVYVSPGSGLAATADGPIVLAEWGGLIERLSGGTLSTIIGGYRANGVAVGPGVTIYFTSDGRSGWGPVGLYSITPDGTVTRLDPP